MNLTNEIQLLRIFMSNTDKFRKQPLYEIIVFAAKRQGLAGATVIKGIMGYGSGSIVNSIRFWEITEKLPIIVEIVDEAPKIKKFFETINPYFDKIEKGILITIEKANIVFYKTGKKK